MPATSGRASQFHFSMLPSTLALPVMLPDLAVADDKAAGTGPGDELQEIVVTAGRRSEDVV
jgi:hypothetical protein